MGGIGSGRWGARATRPTVETTPSVDVLAWYRAGVLRAGIAFDNVWRCWEDEAVFHVRVSEPGSVVVTYRVGGDAPEPVEERVSVEWSLWSFRGPRPAFTCPRCARRAMRLYAGPRLACRICHQLAYESQREDREALALRRARKLRGRLGAFGGVLGPMPGCPRGMWWRTYDRVFNQIVTAERVGARKMLRLLARTDRRRMRRRVG